MLIAILAVMLVAYPAAIGLWLGGMSLTFSLVAFYVVALSAPVLLAACACWRIRA